MKLLDIHTHRQQKEHVAIHNIPTASAAGISSVGIHPWNVDDRWEESFAVIRESAKETAVTAIGECGIDKVNSKASLELQHRVFSAHMELSEALKKPLIIHCVKAFDAITALHKEKKPQQAWIIHGFRGKPQQAIQLIKEGIYLSLGEHFNPESARSIPHDRLFIESDDSSTPINNIYAAVADARGCSIEELSQQIWENARRCGFDL